MIEPISHIELTRTESNGLTVSASAACRILHISERTLKKRLEAGQLRSVQHGRRVYVKLPPGIGSSAQITPPVEWTPRKIVKTLRAMVRDGEPVTRTRVEVLHPGLFSAACDKAGFGSWVAALRAAGIEDSVC